jgi:hypothetical protein
MASEFSAALGDGLCLLGGDSRAQTTISIPANLKTYIPKDQTGVDDLSINFDSVPHPFAEELTGLLRKEVTNVILLILEFG